ncbi:MAG: hypothetical protein LUG46_09420 [Erysipelotrichaceae bacterium]|nr:hypothetical protein [Erysipelotrichaceae bacterium]
MKTFNDYMNYKTTSRTKCHFVTNINEYENSLCFLENQVLLPDNNVIYYKDIEKIKLSLCSRIFNPTVLSDKAAKVLIGRVTKGVFITQGIHMVYSLDMDIMTNEKTYYFESYSLNHILEILNIINKHITIDNPLDIHDILMHNQDSMERQRYLDLNFKNLAKEYHLDNPRGLVYLSL